MSPSTHPLGNAWSKRSQLFLWTLWFSLFSLRSVSHAEKTQSHHCWRLPLALARQSWQPLCFFHLDFSDLNTHWPDRYIYKISFESNNVMQMYFTLAWVHLKVSQLWCSINFLNVSWECIYSFILHINRATRDIFYWLFFTPLNISQS